MPFVNQLGANAIPGSPIGGSNIYGMPPQQTNQDIMSIVNQMKDREMMDFKNKANFMADLSLRQQQRMNNLYDPNKAANAQQQNVVMGQDSNAMSGYQKGELAIRQQEADTEKQKASSQAKFGQEAQDVKAAQEKLNQQKSDQINAEKTADLQRKTDEANKKIELAQKALEQKGQDFDKQLQTHRDLAAAVEERHKIEMENQKFEFQMKLDQMQRQFDEANKLHNRAINDAENSQVTTSVDASGNTKTVTTRKGTATQTVQAVGRDGKTYTIPKDKLNDVDSDGTPHWKPVGGSQDQSQDQSQSDQSDQGDEG